MKSKAKEYKPMPIMLYAISYLWPLLLTWFNLSNNIHYKELDEITYPFLNFNGCTVEV